MLAAEKAAAALAEKAAVVQANAEEAVADAKEAVADANAADNPIPAEVSKGGGVLCTGYVVIQELDCTDHNKFSNNNTACILFEQEERQTHVLLRGVSGEI